MDLLPYISTHALPDEALNKECDYCGDPADYQLTFEVTGKEDEIGFCCQECWDTVSNKEIYEQRVRHDVD